MIYCSGTAVNDRHELARADTQVRPYRYQIERVAGGHFCVPPESAKGGHRYYTADGPSLERRFAAMAFHHAFSADLLLVNGRVLTMDTHDAVAQAVAVKNGKI